VRDAETVFGVAGCVDALTALGRRLLGVVLRDADALCVRSAGAANDPATGTRPQ